MFFLCCFEQTDRFDKINAYAEVEWRLVNAKLVKEHFEATVPSPGI